MEPMKTYVLPTSAYKIYEGNEEMLNSIRDT